MGFKETLMNLADKVSDTVNEGITKGKDSVNKMTEKNRLNKEIKTLTSEIETSLSSIGKILYDEDRGNERFKDIFDAVEAKEAEIENLTKQLNDLEGEAPCPSCGETVSKDIAFCPKCGAKVAQEVKTVEAEVVETAENAEATETTFCNQCGAKLEAGAKFCNQCGNKISE